jgi:hypothetical protein
VAKYFFIGLIGLALLEIARVYLIMPMPGSQHWDSLALAYFLHSYRWVGRIVFLGFILLGAKPAFSSSKWPSLILSLVVLGVVFLFNFRMTAERMFLEPSQLNFSSLNSKSLSDSSLVIAVAHGGEAKAYPIRFIAYHHQVRDQIAGKEIMVTYCSVCRTGRVFDPTVDGHPETFRLVGMDHFNAMFEDSRTGSWWQQANGEAIAGPSKGSQLPELDSYQLTLGKFFELFPQGKVMDADPSFLSKYDSLGKYEFGKSKSKLTGTDSLSWKEKSWVVGIRVREKSKAYDWNDLKSIGTIHDVVAGQPVALILSEDQQSFKAFLRTDVTQSIERLPGDFLSVGKDTLDFRGASIRTGEQVLYPIHAYQEFWHSWRTFNPQTEIYVP